jgi:hypothetical protein
MSPARIHSDDHNLLTVLRRLVTRFGLRNLLLGIAAICGRP